MKIIWATGTDTGKVRSNNQDSVHPAPGTGTTEEALMVAVADGMGGHVGGEIASSTALAAAVFTEGPPSHRITAANRAVLDEVEANPSLRGMGTTLTMAMVEADGNATIGHVGDSRAYSVRDGEMTQLTRDHTVIAEYLAAGKITEDEARRHPQRSVITRAVGIIDDLAVDEFPHRFGGGDILVICSDGLTGMITDADLLGILRGREPVEAVRALIEAANRAGGVDNITVVVVEFQS